MARADRAGGLFFQFRLVVFRGDELNATFVRRDLHDLLAIQTSAPFASVSVSEAESYRSDLFWNVVDVVTPKKVLYRLAKGLLNKMNE